MTGDATRPDALSASQSAEGGTGAAAVAGTACGGELPAATKSLFICAGELSGDRHASKVIANLQKHHKDLKVWGMGGDALEAAGVELFAHRDSLAVFGIFAVVKHLPRLLKLRADIVSAIAERKPDAIMLVDFPGFNLSLAGILEKRCPDIPIIYFISPQIWGSRPWRINVIAAAVKKVLVIFPFEEAIYRKRGIDATFVGHPLVSLEAGAQSDPYSRTEASKQAFLERYSLDPDKPIISIFPGSRKQEIRDFMPVLLKAIAWLQEERPEIQFVMSQANPRIGELIYEEIERRGMRRVIGDNITRSQTSPGETTRVVNQGLRIVPAEENLDLMAVSSLIWAKSGTITLEATLMEKPMLVFYRADWPSFLIFLAFKRVQYVAWPNLLAGKMLVPELIQLDCRAEKLVKYTRDWLDVPGFRQEVESTLKAMKLKLGRGDFAANAAREVEKILGFS